MSGQIGIEESIDLVEVVADFGNVAGLSLEDGKLGVGDLVYIGKLSSAITKLVSIDFGLVLKEAGDYDASELKQIQDGFAARFDIPQDKLELVVEKGLKLAVKWQGVVVESIDFAKELFA